MDVASLPAQMPLELAGVFVGALSGGLAGVRKGFDVFSIMVLAWAAGLGGGVIRDVLIGAVPPVGIAKWEYVVTAAAAGLFTWALHPGLRRVRRLVLVLDAGALALFTVVGTVKALQYGVGLLAAVFAGVITGIGGGMMRDLLTGEVPVVFSQRQLYAVPSVLGAVCLTLLSQADRVTDTIMVVAVVVVLAVRLVGMRFRLVAPGPLTLPARGSDDRPNRSSRGLRVPVPRALRGAGAAERSAGRRRVAGERRRADGAGDDGTEPTGTAPALGDSWGPGLLRVGTDAAADGGAEDRRDGRDGRDGRGGRGGRGRSDDDRGGWAVAAPLHALADRWRGRSGRMGR